MTILYDEVIFFGVLSVVLFGMWVIGPQH